MVRDNPALAALPRYAFTSPEPSRYRIRREPDGAYCSTIEALMHVLGALEGDPPRFRALLAPFEAMIDAQLACGASSPPQRERSMRPRRPAPPQLPASLAARWDDLVCVVGEANAWHAAPGVAAPAPEVIHWVAYRPSDGATFDQIVRPTGSLAPPTLGHCELTAAALAGGCDHATLVARFAAFVRPTDVVCAWGPRSPALFAGHGGALPATQLDLRAIAQRYARRKIGTLEDYAGPAAARNAGVQQAEGDRVAFLGDDTVPAPTWLRAPAHAGATPRTATAHSAMMEVRRVRSSMTTPRGQPRGTQFRTDLERCAPGRALDARRANATPRKQIVAPAQPGSQIFGRY